MKTFDRYVFKEVAVPFGIGLSVYTLSLLINQILRLSSLLVSKGATPETIFKLLVYLLPDFLSFTIPMSTLMGILAGVSRMSTDSEITAFKTMGISNIRLFRPVFLFSFLMMLTSAYLIMFVAPESNYRLKRLYTNIGISQAVNSIKPKTFYNDFPGYVIYFEDIDRETDEWKNVFLYFREGGEKDKVVLAKRGMIIQEGEDNREDSDVIKKKDAFFRLKDATIFNFNRKNPEKDNSVVFYSYFNKNISNSQEIRVSRHRSATQLILPDLVKRIQTLKKPDKKKRTNPLPYQIEYHNKFTLPLACIAFGILGLALGVSTSKGGKISGFIVSLAIIFIYYSVTVICRNMITKKKISVIFGMWAPLIFIFVVGIILFILNLKEKKIKLDKIFILLERIRTYIMKERRVLFVLKYRKSRFRVFNILDVYIAKKLITIFLFIFISIIIIFFVINIIEQADDAIENEVKFSVVLNYVTYSMAEILNYIFPISILTTVLLTFSIMSKNNEITAVKVSGISLYRLVLPAILFGMVISAIAFWVQEQITPDANKKALKLFNKIHNRNRKTSHELQRNWVVSQNRQFYFYQIYEKHKERFRNFGILEFDKDFNLTRRIYAKYAVWSGDTELTLLDGFEKSFSNNKPVPMKNFGPYIINTHYRKEQFLSKSKRLNSILARKMDLTMQKVELIGNRFIFFNSFNEQTDQLNDFLAVIYDGEFKVEKTISAKRASWFDNTKIKLDQAKMTIFSKNSSPIDKAVLPSQKISIPEGRGFFKRKIIASDYMNIAGLQKYIKYLKKSNSDTIRYEAKLYNKYAFPISSLIMVLLAIPFSFIMGNKGAVYGIGLAVGFSMIYWSAFGVFSALGNTAILSPFLSAFAPIIVFATISLYSFLNIKT